MQIPSPALRRVSSATSVCVATALIAGCGWVGAGAGEGAEALPPPPLDTLRAGVTAERNERLRILAGAAESGRRGTTEPAADRSYRIGADDLLDIQVFGVEALSARARVSSGGTVSMPLLGPMPAAGLTPPELATAVEDRLRSTYMNDPQVSVEVLEMRSHSVSVVGAVNSPGAYEISGARTLLQVLALAGGLSEAAGDRVMVVRGRGAADGATVEGEAEETGAGEAKETGIGEAEESVDDEAEATAAETAESTAGVGTVKHGDPEVEPADGSGNADGAPAGAGEPDSPGIIEIDLRALLASGESRRDVDVLPGDVVQVRPAGMVYVVGDVNQPGGFAMSGNEPLSVLRAVALAEGLLPTAAADRAMVLRPSGAGREEIPVNLEGVLSGSQPDPVLREQDILFVPNSTTKSIARGVLDAFVRMATLRGLLY